MFKKIVSRISFSPALVAQLGFYAKRLRKEQATRRLGLIFVALALVVQSLVVFQAPEPANAAHPSDMIPGGLGWSNPDLGKFLSAYDSNWGHTQHAAHQFGITRAEIAAAKYGSFKTGNKIGWGWDTNMPNSRAMKVYDYHGTYVRTLYGRAMNQYYHVNRDNPAFIGHSQKAGWFAINVECGNIVTDRFFDYPEPKPAKVVATKSAINVTQGKVNATKVAAKEKDTLTYTVSLKNTGGKITSVTPVDNVKEVLKYATITNTGGATLNKTKGTLTWPKVSLPPGASFTKSYTVKMLANLPVSKTSCSMTNIFFNSNVKTPVQCNAPEPPAPAKIEATKTAINVTQGKVDATKTIAKAKDTLTYTVSLKNTGGTAQEVTPSDTVKEVLQYAKITALNGGVLNAEAGTLTWPKVSLAPGATFTKTYNATLLDQLTAETNDCSMNNIFFEKKVTVKVDCQPKDVPEEKIDATKAATNTSQGNVDATSTTAKASDRISFTLTAKNTGTVETDITFKDDLTDTLEYATLIDNGGGTFDQATRTLSWPTVKLAPGKQEVRTFTIQMLSKIPASPVGASQGASYNCRMENAFKITDGHENSDSTIIEVDCPVEKKIVEGTVKELPQTGAGTNMLFAGIVLAVATFFYFRSRQLGTEVRLVRRNINEGVF